MRVMNHTSNGILVLKQNQNLSGPMTIVLIFFEKIEMRQIRLNVIFNRVTQLQKYQDFYRDQGMC